MPGMSLTRKLIEEHPVSGRPVAGEEIALHIDQTLLQDATGTLAMLEFEAMGAGSLEVALAMAGEPLRVRAPRVWWVPWRS